MASRWNEEEEHLLRLLIPTNTYLEISNEFKRRVERKLPGFKKVRTEEAIRRKCSRDNITQEAYEEYIDPYEARWNYIKCLTAEYKEASEKLTDGIVENATRKILCLSDIHFPFAFQNAFKFCICSCCSKSSLIVAQSYHYSFF